LSLSGPDRRRTSAALAAAGLPADPGLHRITLGKSGDLVVRSGGVYLKIAGPGEMAEQRVRREADALAWLSSRVRVPDLLWRGEVEGRGALVTTALPGLPLSDVAPGEAAEALAEGALALAALHGLAQSTCPETCPGDGSVAALLAEGRRAAAAGRVDVEDFDPEHRGWTAEQLIAAIEADLPPEADLVPTHGDASLPNLVWSRASGVGFVDVGRLGPGDPWRDFALFLRSAGRNHPGIDAVDLLGRTLPGWTYDAQRDYGFRRLDELA
jgi:aminoglycoside phosphotransferase